MRSMASQTMHRSGKSIVNSKDRVQLEIERSAKGSGIVNCHVFVISISDAQFNIENTQLKYVQY